MSNLDKLRAKNKKLQNLKDMNKEKEKVVESHSSSNLVDEIIKDGVSYDEIGASNKAANESEPKNDTLKEEKAELAPSSAVEEKPVKTSTPKKQTSTRKSTKKETRPVEEKEQSINAAINLVAKRKENKSVRKSFLIKESCNEKLKALADELGTSENDVVNQILESVFNDM
jgi:hypothetical protein